MLGPLKYSKLLHELFAILLEVVKNYIELFAKYAGLVTICFEWLAVALFFILRPDYFNGQYPLSYFAALPETRVVFSACLTIAATSFWIFTRYHLPKYYVVPVRLFTASMLGYGALALVPFDPSDTASDIIHRILALFFSATFFGGIYLMGKHNKNKRLHAVSYAVVGLSALVIFTFFITPKGSHRILLLEALSAFIGQAWILWISFHSFNANTKSIQIKR